MNCYRVRFYKVGVLGYFTNADDYEDVYFQSPKTLKEFCKELMRDGIEYKEGKKWVTPSAIVEIEKEEQK